MKKILVFLLSFVLLLPSSTIGLAKASDYSLESNITNKEVLRKYEKLIENQKNNSYLKKINNIEYAKNNYNTIDAVQSVNDIFKEYNQITSVYGAEKDKVFTNIIKSKSTGKYGIIEVVEGRNDLFISLDGNSYIVYKEGDDIFLTDESGYKVPVLISQNNTKTNGTIGSKNQVDLLSASNRKFGKYYGPYYKTNKVLFEVVEALGIAAGTAGVVLENPVLGTISYVLGTAASLGSKLYVTLYIKYWQANDINDPSYVKEKRNYYKYNNYTGYVKTTYNYFYSTKPY